MSLPKRHRYGYHIATRGDWPDRWYWCPVLQIATLVLHGKQVEHHTLRARTLMLAIDGILACEEYPVRLTPLARRLSVPEIDQAR